MQILNPCRRCIVKSMCQIRCPARQDFWDTRERYSDKVAMLLVTISFIIIFITFLKS